MFKRLINVFAILLAIVFVFSGCTSSQINNEVSSIKSGVQRILEKHNITNYSFAEDLIPDGYNKYILLIDIPEIDEYTDEEKVDVLEDICDEGSGFFKGNSTNDSDFIMIYVEVNSNGNRYVAYDGYSYFVNSNEVNVKEHKYYTDNSGNYDKNDPYYSSNDSDNDGYINQEEFQNAVGDWMDDHGY